MNALYGRRMLLRNRGFQLPRNDDIGPSVNHVAGTVNRPGTNLDQLLMECRHCPGVQGPPMLVLGVFQCVLSDSLIVAQSADKIELEPPLPVLGFTASR